MGEGEGGEKGAESGEGEKEGLILQAWRRIPMSVDTCRYRWVPVRYEKPYKCPQCEMGSDDLIPQKLAIITGRMGNSVGLRCDVCNYGFIVVEERQ